MVKSFKIETKCCGFPVGTTVYTKDEGNNCYLNKELKGEYWSHSFDYSNQVKSN